MFLLSGFKETIYCSTLSSRLCMKDSVELKLYAILPQKYECRNFFWLFLRNSNTKCIFWFFWSTKPMDGFDGCVDIILISSVLVQGPSQGYDEKEWWNVCPPVFIRNTPDQKHFSHYSVDSFLVLLLHWLIKSASKRNSVEDNKAATQEKNEGHSCRRSSKTVHTLHQTNLSNFERSVIFRASAVML